MTGAQIIPFPSSRPSPQQQKQLSTALGSLSTALRNQQAALERWRQAMNDLAGSMQTMSHSLDPLDPGPKPGR